MLYLDSFVTWKIFFLCSSTVTVQQPSYSVTTGNWVTLVCSVSSSLPITNVYWQRIVGGTITTISSNTNTNKYSGNTTTTPSLTIFSVSSSDVGAYTCFASNSVGTGQSSTTTLSDFFVGFGNDFNQTLICTILTVIIQYYIF